MYENTFVDILLHRCFILSQTVDQGCYTISEAEADRHELHLSVLCCHPLITRCS